MTPPRGTVRRQVRINCPPGDVWPHIAEPDRIAEWFPGIVSSATDPDAQTRVITTAAGLPIPEQIVTNDAVQRRFQYRITGPMFKEHLSTIDVLDLEDGTSLVVYGCDAVPATLALVIAGAAGNALENLKRRIEQ